MTAKKTELLGMSVGKAAGRLRKTILFHLVCKLEENVCYRCQKMIETSEECSIEHKESWQLAANPVEAFFDLENIAFSHRSCNYGAASRPNKIYSSSLERERARDRRRYDSRMVRRNRWRQKQRDLSLPYT